jgi:hypothetical protein
MSRVAFKGGLAFFAKKKGGKRIALDQNMYTGADLMPFFANPTWRDILFC